MKPSIPMRNTPALKERFLKDRRSTTGWSVFKLADDQSDQTNHTEHGEDANVAGGKPIFPLAAIEKELQRSDPWCQKTDPPKIHPACSSLDVMRIDHEPAHQHQGQNADGEIEIKNPPPAVIVGDPSAESGPENGGQQNADSKGRHGVAVSFLGKSFEQNRRASGCSRRQSALAEWGK